MTTTLKTSQQRTIEDPKSLRSCLDQVEQETEAIHQSLETLKRRRADLEAERAPLVLPARSKRDAAAQDRMRAIDEELAKLGRDASDDEAALSSLAAQHRSIEARIEVSEWELSRAELLKRLGVFLKDDAPARLAVAVEQVKILFAKTVEEDAEIAQALFAFDVGLQGVHTRLHKMQASRSDVLAAKLSTIVPTPYNSTFLMTLRGVDIGKQRRQVIEDAIEALDSLKPSA